MKTIRDDEQCFWITGDEWHIVIRRYESGFTIVTHEGPPTLPAEAMVRVGAWIGKHCKESR